MALVKDVIYGHFFSVQNKTFWTTTALAIWKALIKIKSIKLSKPLQVLWSFLRKCCFEELILTLTSMPTHVQTHTSTYMSTPLKVLNCSSGLAGITQKVTGKIGKIMAVVSEK